MTADGAPLPAPLRTLIVDDEPLAVERMQILCARIPSLNVVGTASDGAQALRLVEALEENDDVQNVHSNFDVDQKLLEEVAG